MQSMADQAPDIAQRLGMDVHVEVAGDEEALDIVRAYPNVGVVVTRGGLAEIARQIEGLNVVEIAMSPNELLGNVGVLTAQGIRRIGIVSRANLFSGAAGEFRIQDVEVRIRPQIDEAGIRNTVTQLVEEGFEAIIGCRVAYKTAEACGVKAVFLESGPVSITVALQEAQRILKAKERERLQAAQLAAIIDNIDEAVIAVTPAHEVSFFNRNARHICTPAAGMGPDFSDLLSLFESSDREQITTINANKVIARAILLEFDDRTQGKVITLQEVARIQASETKIRSSLHQKGLYARYRFTDLIGDSATMRELIKRAKVYAGHDSNLLIYGETGTGKEVFAQSVHNHSRRSKGPFVSVNTASIPPSLLESELFGYVDGAFTGARKGGKAGLFELAHQGTLFLDEIGELAPEIQSRLLRVLQEREIMRIGDDKIIPIDVRIISATNRDLFQQTQSGAFRQDLYYRIHVVGLRIPSLRERSEDVPQIFEHYLQRFTGRNSAKGMLTRAARELLSAYAWPGNIRQLRNIAEVVAYAASEVVDARDISSVLGEQQRSMGSSNFISIPESNSLKQMESEIIRSLLAKYPAEDVCQRLGISRVTLWRKMKKMPINADSL
jgi:transcriptional regulator with PAS, ATPase and Fis domain